MIRIFLIFFFITNLYSQRQGVYINSDIVINRANLDDILTEAINSNWRLLKEEYVNEGQYKNAFRQSYTLVNSQRDFGVMVVNYYTFTGDTGSSKILNHTRIIGSESVSKLNIYSKRTKTPTKSQTKFNYKTPYGLATIYGYIPPGSDNKGGFIEIYSSIFYSTQ